MRIQIDDNVIDQLQRHTTLCLTDSDREFFAQWLIDIGLAAVNSALQKHPQLTFRELLMMSLRSAKQ